jgi:ferric-dicitrate binding protein FerR (iron transport regulator)
MTSARDQRDEARLVAALRAVEVDDLGPSRLEFERRRLMARLAFQPTPVQRRRRLALAAGLSATALAAAAALLFALAPVAGTPEEDSTVTLAGTWRLEPGDAISRGLPVRVGDGSRARLELPDGSSVEAAPGTRMALLSGDGSAIRLEAGHAVVAVTPRPSPGLFRVVTPEAEVRVHGTVFSVTVDAAGTTVRLHEGEVRLACGDRAVAMQPGHQVVASARGLVALQTFDEEERALDARLAPGDVPGRGVGDGPVLAEGVPEDVEGPDAPVADGAGEEEPAEQVAKEAMAGSGPLATRPAGRTRPVPSLLERVAGHARGQRHEEVLALTEDAWRGPVSSDSELLFHRARSLGRLGRWAEAAGVYRRIADSDRARGPEALYLAADALRRARDYAGSAAVADRAIAAGGPNADHAWSVKFGALTGLGRYQDAAEAAEAYLAAHPGGAHVGEAHFVRGTGLRLERRWGEAAAAYGRSLERGEGSAAIVEDGRFYRGYCLLMSGQREQGAEALEAYLGEHPYGRHAAKARAALGR